MKIISIVFLIYMIIPCTASALSTQDSGFVGDYPQNLALKGLLYHNILQLVNNETGQELIPNNPLGIGLGISYKSLAFDISLGHEIPFTRDEKYGPTESFDFQVHEYLPYFAGDLYIQKYQGFYNDDSSSTAEQMLYPGLKFYQVGLTGQWVYNGDRFSYQAAFGQGKRQLQSAGSVLFGGGLYYFRIESDSSFLLGGSETLSSYQWGVNAGYAYNWVFLERWLIHVSASLGLNASNRHLHSFFGNDFSVNPTILSRISFGYTRESWSAGLAVVLLMLEQQYAKVEQESGRFELYFIRRFLIGDNKQ